MKVGIILYITGDEEAKENVRSNNSQQNLNLKADQVTLASNLEEVIDHWIELTKKGMHHIKCLIAETETQNEIKLTGQELRLYG